MVPLNRQRGLSLWMVMVLAAILGTAGVAGLKLFPIYMESFKIDSAMKAMVQQPTITDMSKAEIRSAILKRFDIDTVETINYGNIKELLKIEKKGKRVTLSTEYQAVTPVMGNVHFLVKFEKKMSN